MVKLFPKGSLEKPSDARPLIWRQWPDFKRRIREFGALAAELEVAADRSGGAAKQVLAKQVLAKQVLAKQVLVRISETCSACHKLYRFERKSNKKKVAKQRR